MIPTSESSHCSVQFSCSVVSEGLRSLFVTQWTAACQASLSITNSQSPPKPMSMCQWCHPAISSSVIPFSSCPQSLPASQSFPMSQLFAWGGQSTGVSPLASFLPKKSQDWSPFPYWLLQNIEHSSLCYRLGPCWLSVLYIAYQCFYILGISLSLSILLQMFFHSLWHAVLFIE